MSSFDDHSGVATRLLRKPGRAVERSPGPSRIDEDVSTWSLTDRLVEAAKLATPHLPKEMRAQFAGLFSAANVAFTAAILTAWAVSHAYGIGEAVDIALAVIGLVMLGSAAIDVAKDIARYARLAESARTRRDLEAAAIPLARAVSVIGVATFVALLCKGAGKAAAGKSPASGGGAAAGALAAEEAQPAYRSFTTIDHAPQGEGQMAHAIRKAILDDYLKEQPGLNRARGAAKRRSHITGIDLSKPIIRRRLPPDTELIMYERIGGQPGIYVGYPGTTAAQMGVLAEGRIVRKYRVVEPLEAFETTAAKFETGKVQGVGGKGGGQQLILPPDWERRVQRLW